MSMGPLGFGAGGGGSVSAPLTLASGTITANDPALVITQTWNNGSATFDMIYGNATLTAAGTASYLIRLQGNSADLFRVRKDGVMRVGPSTGHQLGWDAGSNGQLSGYYSSETKARNAIYLGGFGQVVIGQPPAVTLDQTLFVQSGGARDVYIQGLINTNTTVEVCYLGVAARNRSGAYTGPGHSLVIVGSAAAHASTAYDGGDIFVLPGAGVNGGRGGHVYLDGGVNGGGADGDIIVGNSRGYLDIRGADGAQAATGTLGNAPTAGDPAEWIPVKFNGNVRYVPVWA